MNKQDEINELRARLDALEASLGEPEQQWADGTPGWFWDGNIRERLFGFLGRATMLSHNPYGHYSSPALKGQAYGYAHFEPLTEAILPAMIKHDGGEYPGDLHDTVTVTFRDGAENTRRASSYRWDHRNAKSDIVSYRIIKRAGK